MANSPLSRTGEKKPVIDKGHGTDALGPSDTSDSGSDIRGPGLTREGSLDLERGTTSDPDLGGQPTAGPDLGDADLDSDTDSAGTGERATAGRDASARENDDRLPDKVERVVRPEDFEEGAPSGADQSGLATDKGGGRTSAGRGAGPSGPHTRPGPR